MKKELGDCTSRFSLCVRASSSGDGCRRSRTMIIEDNVIEKQKKGCNNKNIIKSVKSAIKEFKHDIDRVCTQVVYFKHAGERM
jgi:hypothetical protein